MPNVVNLIKAILKKLNNKHTEFSRFNCINKAICPLKGKCQYECIVYKIQVYNRPNNKNSKSVLRLYSRNFKKKKITIEVVSHTKYTGIVLVNQTMCGKSKRINK